MYVYILLITYIIDNTDHAQRYAGDLCEERDPSGLRAERDFEV